MNAADTSRNDKMTGFKLCVLLKLRLNVVCRFNAVCPFCPMFSHFPVHEPPNAVTYQPHLNQFKTKCKRVTDLRSARITIASWQNAITTERTWQHS